MVATVAATATTLGGIRRTILTAHTLEIGLFAGHTGILPHVAYVSLCDYESEGRRFESCRARSQKPCKTAQKLDSRKSHGSLAATVLAYTFLYARLVRLVHCLYTLALVLEA